MTVAKFLILSKFRIVDSEIGVSLSDSFFSAMIKRKNTGHLDAGNSYCRQSKKNVKKKRRKSIIMGF